MNRVGRALGAAVAAVVLLGSGAGVAAAEPGPAGLVSSSALLLYEQDTGTVVFARDAQAELPIASTTKMMTALVTALHEPAGAILTERDYDAGPGESLAPVPVGARLSLADMLRAMLLPSGNNVAYSLAIDVAGSIPRFVAMMNAEAARLGLHDTHFTTPIGLDSPAGNHSTAIDLARLAGALLRVPLLARIVSEPSARLADGIALENLNDLLGRYRWVVGVKTGHTAEAGWCLVAAARLDGVHLTSVVLGAPTFADQDLDTLAMLRFGLHRFERVPIARSGQVFAKVGVIGRPRRVRLVASRSLALVVARSAALRSSRVGVPARVRGPLPAGTVEGHIRVRERGRVVAEVPLVTAKAVPAPKPSSTWVWLLIGGIGLTAILLGCSLPLVRRSLLRSTLGTPG
jgi:D-alanyl-D-alanine carboxypeptidase (penicillin-binding protein 5/6)